METLGVSQGRQHKNTRRLNSKLFLKEGLVLPKAATKQTMLKTWSVGEAIAIEIVWEVVKQIETIMNMLEGDEEDLLEAAAEYEER